MAFPEALEVQASYVTTILAEEGHPPPKIKGNKIGAKCFLGNIKCFKLMFFLKKEKKIEIIKIGLMPTHPTFNHFFFKK